MKTLLFLIWSFASLFLHGGTVLSEGNPPIRYYFDAPKERTSYSIYVNCNEFCGHHFCLGDFHKNQAFTLEEFKACGFGVLNLETPGVEGNSFDKYEFAKYNSWSHQLQDHLLVLKELQENPPQGWDGKLIFAGNAPIILDLAFAHQNTIATIHLFNATDSSWAQQLWEDLAFMKKNSFLFRTCDRACRWLPIPESYRLPRTMEELETRLKKIEGNPTPDKCFLNRTNLYHSAAYKKAPVDYKKIRFPLLVWKGPMGCRDFAGTERFIEKAREAGADVHCIEAAYNTLPAKTTRLMIVKSLVWLLRKISVQQEAALSSTENGALSSTENGLSSDVLLPPLNEVEKGLLGGGGTDEVEAIGIASEVGDLGEQVEVPLVITGKEEKESADGGIIQSTPVDGLVRVDNDDRVEETVE